MNGKGFKSYEPSHFVTKCMNSEQYPQKFLIQ